MKQIVRHDRHAKDIQAYLQPKKGGTLTCILPAPHTGQGWASCSRVDLCQCTVNLSTQTNTNGMTYAKVLAVQSGESGESASGGLQVPTESGTE